MGLSMTELQRHVEREVERRRSKRRKVNAGRLAENQEELAGGGLLQSGIRGQFVMSVLVEEARRILDDFLQIGVETCWKAYGRIPPDAKDCLCVRCDNIPAYRAGSLGPGIDEAKDLNTTSDKFRARLEEAVQPSRAGRSRLRA